MLSLPVLRRAASVGLRPAAHGAARSFCKPLPSGASRLRTPPTPPPLSGIFLTLGFCAAISCNSLRACRSDSRER